METRTICSKKGKKEQSKYFILVSLWFHYISIGLKHAQVMSMLFLLFTFVYFSLSFVPKRTLVRNFAVIKPLYFARDSLIDSKHCFNLIDIKAPN